MSNVLINFGIQFSNIVLCKEKSPVTHSYFTATINCKAANFYRNKIFNVNLPMSTILYLVDKLKST